MRVSRRRFLASISAASVAVTTGSTWAQDDAYPRRFVRLLVPYPASGTAPDLHARIFAEPMSARLGQRVVVENRPGAGGTIGAAAAAKAAPDGYTILWAAGSLFACNPFLYKNLQYAFEDFTPIGCFSDCSFVLFVRRGLGIKTLAALLDRMRAEPGGVRFANGGIGSQLHLTWERLMRLARVQGMNVPFQTGGTLQALLGDTVDVGCSVLDPGLIQYFSSGDLVPLAITSPTRRPQLPNVPTFIECGFPGFTASGGYAALVPRDTPDAIAAKLRTEFDRVTSDPAIVAKLDQLAAEVPQWRRADDYKAWFAGDRELWRKLIEETGITLG
ncbi:tripartite tricarboxylate transporter substrate binding protein [Bradyrhizobium sp. LHD-71]|uniref:Bug family tripartite tricarboxylate transporter substrate binding protein n=1 Tax=Bradyrhizobium sp. LHD-71 TaxID=3072141 RepID=UPI00280EA123|nr:tripartite tricarboxylate transporter substrate binding protein [Bradyrhizobium sp. LHD-71]MDQ8730278.1 tripartite tricarboxylate transporter substrate binding protein [Bradyrhizobium sp. LHD-71]